MREATALKMAEARRDPGTEGSGTTTRLRPPRPRSPEEDLNGLRMAVRAAGPSIEELAVGLADMPSAQRASAVRGMQQTLGNRRVGRLAVQAKLKLGPPGDKYEQEADRVARQVVEIISSSDQGAVQIQEGKEEELELRRKVDVSSVAGGIDVGPDLESAIQRARGGGEPLSDGLRRSMEQAFGADFGGVRVHADGEADALSRSLQARAFTTGQDIFLRRVEYQPGSSEGQRLLAHELTHTVQQGASVQNKRITKNSHLNSLSSHEAAHQSGMDGGASALNRREVGQLQEDYMTKVQLFPMLQRELVGAGLGGRRGVVEGRAGRPRSLSITLDPSQMSNSEIEQEIFEIRQWLLRHQEGSADRQLLLGVLRQMEAQLAPMTNGLPANHDEFAVAFNREFRSVLHAFPEEQPLTIPPIRGPPGEASGVAVPTDTLCSLFTPTQRDKLMDFIATRRIPERLFNGDDIGATTAQQRLLLSAHILANGTYRPGSFEQRIHARMCWHWVQIVHHYAGGTPAAGPIAQGVMGSFDPFGGVVLGSGQSQTIYQERPVYAEDLPSIEGQGGVGPIHAGTAHARAAAAELERLAANPTARRTVHRRPSLPFERLIRDLQPGDWLWYYNANASPGGSHSVIFSRWASDPLTNADGIRYREAICFSQSSPGAGGREHTARLGDLFVPSQRIYPVTHVTRVSPDARPAITPLEFLPGRRAKALSDKNQQFLRVKERHLHRPVDIELLRLWLRGQNQNYIDRLRERLTDRQWELLGQANENEEIETLVRLNQRLCSLVRNAEILGQNMASTFGGLEQRHAEAQARLDEERARAELKLAKIEADLEPIQAAIDERERLRREIDLAPEIRRLRHRLGVLWPRIRYMSAGPEREQLQRQRQQLRQNIQDLLAQQRAQRGVRRALTAEIRRLRRQARPFLRRRERIMARPATGERELPYGLLHPGRLRGQDTRRITGLLAHLNPQPDWSTLTVQAHEETR